MENNEYILINDKIDNAEKKGYNKALEDVEVILLKKFKFAGMPLIKEIKRLKKEVQESQ